MSQSPAHPSSPWPRIPAALDEQGRVIQAKMAQPGRPPPCANAQPGQRQPQQGTLLDLRRLQQHRQVNPGNNHALIGGKALAGHGKACAAKQIGQNNDPAPLSTCFFACRICSLINRRRSAKGDGQLLSMT